MIQFFCWDDFSFNPGNPSSIPCSQTYFLHIKQVKQTCETYMASICDLYIPHHGFEESSLVTSTLGCFCSYSIHVPSPACRHMSCVTTFHVQHFILCNSKQSHVRPIIKCVNSPLQEAHKLSSC